MVKNLRNNSYRIGLLIAVLCLTTSIRTFGMCTADFSYTIAADTVFFTDASSSNVVHRTWKFGDGQTSATRNPYHRYTRGKSYQVTLIVFDTTRTCSDSIVKYITVPKDGCDANFEFYPYLGNVANGYVFDDTSGQNYTKEYWSFGDGSIDSSSAGKAVHKYTRSGPFTACRIVIDTNRGCTDTVCKSVPFITCSARFNITRSGDTVFFHNTSTNAKYYYWTFGDGDTSSQRDPFHVYQRNRVYTACLTITDSSLVCSKSYCYTIVTPGTSTCDASFSLQQVGNSGIFRVTTSASGTTYTWDFGDGTVHSGTNVGHGYGLPVGQSTATYTACLTAYDSSSHCSDTQCKTITVYDTCASSFTYWVNTGRVGFMNGSRSTNPKIFEWDFGDGDTSMERDPTHDYQQPGWYKVCLTVSDTSIPCSRTFCDSVYIDSVGRWCEADFSYTVKDSTVSLTNTSRNSTHFRWTTSTGDSSVVSNPTFSFPGPGNYTICLYVTDTTTQCVDSICKVVRIDSGKSCRSFFRLAVDTTQKFRLFLINGSSNKSTHSYLWDFGDSSTSTSRNPIHKYNTFGKYYVCLTVSDSTTGCSDTYCDSLGLDSLGRLLKADGFELIVLDEGDISVRTVDKLDAKIFPNPTTDNVTIVLNEAISGDAKAELYNMQGLKVTEVVISAAGKAEINLKDQADGLYILHVYGGNKQVQKKLVKMSH
ncbi:MAG: PKD domain-containing protein [Bacteroidia bacterium]|nr:PKD domain-containing protein [Bacteroidia bacterium]